MFVDERDGQMRGPLRRIVACVTILLLLCCTVGQAQSSDDRQQLLATVHVHSTASTGDLTVEALAERA